MGRIDEALRRSGGELAKQLPAADAQAAFVAPWSTAADAPAPAVDERRLSVANTVPNLEKTLLDSEPTGRHSIAPSWMHKLVIAPSPNAQLVEQFRGLAAALHRARSEAAPGTHLRVVMVTSADASEGKTLTAANLALTLSESYKQRVLWVDADLRRPSLGQLCQIPDTGGLSEGLKATTEQKLRVVSITDTLTVLPAGRPDPDPMSSLTSPRMSRILREAETRFDWVVLDAPPIGPIADAGLLCSMVDAVLLVVRAEQTKCAAVQKAVESIGRDRILGVVLNGADDLEDVGYGDYYSHPRE